MKPGWQSSEWWSTIIAQALAVAALIHPGFDAGKYQGIASAVAVLAAAIASGVYALSRGKVKAAHAYASDPAVAPATLWHSAFDPGASGAAPQNSEAAVVPPAPAIPTTPTPIGA